MNKDQLRKQIRETEKLFERRKLKRSIRTVLFYAAILFGISYLQGRLGNASLLDVAGEIVVCIILSVIQFLFNTIVFSQLFEMSKQENAHLEHLKNELRDEVMDK